MKSVTTKDVTALSQSRQTKRQCFVVESVPMNLSGKWIQLGMEPALPLIYQESEKSEFASIETVEIRYPKMPEKRANIAAIHAAQKHAIKGRNS
jgi:hypothetical protein